jgi:hypothetical protein
VELLGAHASSAGAAAPFAMITQATMGALPFRDRAFDCVVQARAFSSCLDESIREAAACEMTRVLADDGCILWLDLNGSKRTVSYLSGISQDELRSLFPGMEIRVRRLGARPEWLGAVTSVANQGILRSLVRRVPAWRHGRWAQRRPVTKLPLILAAAMERVPALTCYLGAVIRRRAPGA